MTDKQEEYFVAVELRDYYDGWLYKRGSQGTIIFRDEVEPGFAERNILTPELKEQIRNNEKNNLLTEDM